MAGTRHDHRYMSRPGLSKARRPDWVTVRSSIRAHWPRWRELLERADVVSEGAPREEGASRVWYGSTSLILPLTEVPEAERSFLASFAERDVHVRLHAVRTARQEAAMRAPAGIGRAHCEIRVQNDARGIRIDVDVQAPLIEGSRDALSESSGSKR